MPLPLNAGRHRLPSRARPCARTAACAAAVLWLSLSSAAGWAAALPAPAPTPAAAPKPQAIGLPPTLKMQNSSALFGLAASLKAQVSNPAGPVVGAEVVFYVDGTSVGMRKSGADGVAQFDFTMPEQFKSGAHPIAAMLSAPLPPLKAEASMDVVKMPVTMLGTIGLPSLNYADTAPYKVEVSGDVAPKYFSAGPHPASTITFKFNGEQKTLKSDGGKTATVALFQIKASDYGKTLHADIIFEGDDHYLPASFTTQDVLLFTPMNDVADFQMGVKMKSDVTLQLGQSVDLTLLLGSGKTASTFKALPNAKVGAWGTNTSAAGSIDMGTGITNASGEVTLHYTYTQPATPGWYKVQSSMFQSNQPQGSMHAPLFSGAFTIAKTPVLIDAVFPSSAPAGETLEIYAQIQRKHDHLPAAGLIDLVGPSDTDPNGQFLLATGATDAQGRYTFKVKTGAGQAGAASYTLVPRSPQSAIGSLDGEVRKFTINLLGQARSGGIAK